MAVSVVSAISQPWRVFREGLYELFWSSVKTVDSRIPDMFNVHTSGRGYEELQGYAGTGDFNTWPDGQTLSYDVVSSRYLSTFTHVRYAKGIRYTQNMIADAKYNLIQDSTSQLGIAAAATKETQATALFNNGFTTVWHATEAQYLFATSHPLANGSTGSNLATGALSLTTLETGIALLRKTKDDQGRPMNIIPEVLMVPPDLEITALKLVQSPDDPSTANRAVNPVQRMRLRVVVNAYLTSTTAWFLRGNQYATELFDREPLRTAMTDDFDTGDTKHKASFRFVCGAKDWRGWVASTGA
jgi:hypothetical protein